MVTCFQQTICRPEARYRPNQRYRPSNPRKPDGQHHRPHSRAKAGDSWPKAVYRPLYKSNSVTRAPPPPPPSSRCACTRADSQGLTHQNPWTKMRLKVGNHGDYNSVPLQDKTAENDAVKQFNTSTPRTESDEEEGAEKCDVTPQVMNIESSDQKLANGAVRSPSDNDESFLSSFSPNDCDGDKSPSPDASGALNTFSSIASKTFDSVARRGRLYAKRQQRRLVFKDGECNISKNQINEKKRRYFRDLFTTLLEIKWRYNLMLFGCAFVTSWMVFAFLWWIICIAHGDHLLTEEEAEEVGRCVAHVYNFQTAVLFSIETQHTIGYGFRMVEPKCAEAFILLMVQSCLGVFIQSLLTGVIFAKLSRPKRRAKTMMFSKNAVICQRDGELFLLFRVGDMRKSPIIQTNIRSVMVKSRYTEEGELIPLCQYPIELETETSSNAYENFVLLSWPITVVHRINQNSPLWEVSAEQLLQEQFELVVILEGTIEDTGMLAQMRTSYLPGEIAWGHRLAPLFAFWKDKGQYQVDFTQFDVTIPIETPECSAKELAVRRARATGQDQLSKEALFMSNFLTIPAVRYNKGDNGSIGTSIFKRMRSSLKRRRSDRQRNGSLPSISFNGSMVGFDELRMMAARARRQQNDDEKEVEVDVSVESSIGRADNQSEDVSIK